MPPAGVLFVVCLFVVLSVHFFLLICPDCPGFAFYPHCTTHTTQISMPPAGFEPAIPAGVRLQAEALDRSATGIGCKISVIKNIGIEIVRNVSQVNVVLLTAGNRTRQYIPNV